MSKSISVISFFVTVFMVGHSLSLLSSDSEKNWKVKLLNGYMQRYESIKDAPSHKGISLILQESLKEAVPLVPDADQELIEAVRSQVGYFNGLQDQESIDREVKKCVDGMKHAAGLLARFAPDSFKADILVDRFKQEYENRMIESGKKT